MINTALSFNPHPSSLYLSEKSTHTKKIHIQVVNVQLHYLHWIRGCLKNRQTVVKKKGIRSKRYYLQNGVPQGGLLSPTLFLTFINGVQKQISKTVYPSLYADDLALLCTEEELSTTNYKGSSPNHFEQDKQVDN